MLIINNTILSLKFGWIDDLQFYVLTFESFLSQDDGRVIMIGSVLWDSITIEKRFPSQAGQRLTHRATRAPKYSQTCLKGSPKGRTKKWLLKTGDLLIQVELHYFLV